jgi:chemotaxis protein MotB
VAAEKKGTVIVIKKIYQTGGHHGGSWKVALADFMTALMCFFLVMWLLSTSSETKKAVSDYFSTPSVIEYNYANYGARITLEKLFLDLMNEPMKAIASFVEPADVTPNLLDMGSEKVVQSYVVDQMNDYAVNVVVNPDGFEFLIPDYQLFIPGTAQPSRQFVTIMDKMRKVTAGLEDSDVKVTSMLFNQSVQASNPDMAKKVANERLDMIQNKIKASLESTTTDVTGQFLIDDKKGFIEGQSERPPGVIKFEVHQKSVKANGQAPTRLKNDLNNGVDMSTYNQFVDKAAQKKNR